MIDETHDPALTSWVASANGHPDFPIQNLPFGVFSPSGGAPRGGVAIGAAWRSYSCMAAEGSRLPADDLRCRQIDRSTRHSSRLG